MILAAMALAVAPVPDKWVEDIKQIESNGRCFVLGDGGKAAGPFQFHKTGWEFVTRIRKGQSQPTYPYSKATDPVIAREYAVTYLNNLRKRVSREIGREANIAETWLAFNLGFAGFQRYRFQPGLVPGMRGDKALDLWKRNK